MAEDELVVHLHSGQLLDSRVRQRHCEHHGEEQGCHQRDHVESAKEVVEVHGMRLNQWKVPGTKAAEIDEEMANVNEEALLPPAVISL
jgi:hypothetical protein